MTPLELPAPLEESTLEHGVSPESPDTPVSAPICSCCASPWPEEPSRLTDDVPVQGLRPSTTLEDQFLSTLNIYSTTPFCVQAVAIAPQDDQVSGHWPLIELLCHRVFATFPNQGRIRQISTSHYERISPGDVLIVAALPLTQGCLPRMEATITRGSDNALVATVAVLCDGSPLGLTADAALPWTEDFVAEFEKLSTSSPPDHGCWS